MAGLDRHDHGAARPDRLVVGMGVDGHQVACGRLGRGRCGVGIGLRLIGHARMLARGSTGRSAPAIRGATIALIGPPPARRRRVRSPACRHRLLDRPRRPVLHDAARRPRRGRHQGRAARGRRDARLGPAVGRVEAEGTRTAAYYLAINRNKRSIRLDLKTATGAEVLRRLLATRRRPGRELPGRRLRAARLRRRRARGAQPAASSTWRSPATGPTARPRTGPATTSSSRRRRPDVDHRAPPTTTAASRPRSASRSATS